MSALLPKPVESEPLQDQFFSVRILTANDANAFAALRLGALEKDGRVFAASYDDEKKLTDSEWHERCTPTRDQCLIGIFKQDELIGVTAAMKWEEDPKGRTALFRSSYILPGERGKGLSSLLVSSRVLWAKRHGGFDSAVLFHREGHWIGEMLKQVGAQEEPRLKRPMRWANGDTADSIWYRLRLG